MRMLEASDRGTVVCNTAVAFVKALYVLAERKDHSDDLMSWNELRIR